MKQTTHECNIPFTSTIVVNTNLKLGECTYTINDQSGNAIWTGFIQLNSLVDSFEHTVNTYNPDIMIIRQLASLGNVVEQSFLKEVSTNGLTALCDAAVSVTPSPENIPSFHG